LFYIYFIKQTFYILLFFLISFKGGSQSLTQEEQSKIDSLSNIIDNPNSHDTALIAARAELGEVQQVYRLSLWDSIANDCQVALARTPNKQVMTKLLKLQASAISNLGIISSSLGQLDRSIAYFEKGLEINRQSGNKRGEAEQLENLGAMYDRTGKVVDALDYYNKSLVIYESLKDKKGIASGLNRVGQIYLNQGDLINAILKLNECLEISRETNSKIGIATAYGNLGNAYRKGDPECEGEGCEMKAAKIALDYYFMSLELLEELEEKNLVATTLSNIGSIFNRFGDPSCEGSKEECLKKGREISMIYAEKTLAIRKEMNDVLGILSSVINLGYANYNLKKIEEAEKYGLRGLEMSKQIGMPVHIRNVALLLSNVYVSSNKGLKSLEMYKLHITMRDSLNNEATQKATAQQQAKYEYEKQKVLDDAEHDKLLAIEQEEKEKQQILTGATAGGLGLVVVFLIFVFNRLRVTKKQKLVIEEQKQEVEQQKEEVEQAHDELEEKNQEIMDSITYAKRIQSAILPPLKIVKEYLQESFILYKPKDIVAGDFYWLEHKDNKVLFAAADCTGHGVPGAMVSVVCNNALNRSVREHGLTDPGEILTKTREIVVQEFEKSDEEVKDGMDIAICSLEGNKLQYAGAHNPLWIIRGGEILETKANKQPIGQFDNPEPYTTHEFELQQEDSIYIFSDGYVDQFGGEKGKKFKARAFRELLLSIQDKPMEAQKNIIDEAFETWRGNLEQIDDVCVIGVRV